MNTHIGNVIKSEYEKSGMKLNVFAERIGMTYRNVYRVFERTDINTDLLVKIGAVLNYDFFSHYTKTNLNTVQEPKTVYEKKRNKKGFDISLNISFNDDEKRNELLKLLFGDQIPESFRDNI